MLFVQCQVSDGKARGKDVKEERMCRNLIGGDDPTKQL